MTDLKPSEVIDGVIHIALDRHGDDRGFLMETFRAEWLPDHTFVQANLSKSAPGVLRGFHYHLRQEDLWLVPHGIASVALVDLRSDSDTYLKVERFKLSGPHAVLIPIGVAHGFFAETEMLMSYLVTNYYDGSDELGVAWDDPDIGAMWPVAAPTLSERDQANKRWADVPDADRPGGAS